MNPLPVPPWLAKWPVTFPCRRGAWTVRNGDNWGALIPETGEVSIVEPATDPALPGLGPALECGTLLSYRVGRRAVVVTADSYIKVVRPKRVARVVTNHETVSRSTSCTIPTIVGHETDGRITVSIVDGYSLHQKLRHGCPDAQRDDAQCDDAECLSSDDFGHVVDAAAALHDASPPVEIADLSDGADWIDTVERFQDRGVGFLRAIHEHIPRTPPARTHMVHGDLHDKNVILGVSGAALIDLDGVAAGPVEADVGNLTAHIMLRALQADRGVSVGWNHVGEFLEAYRRRRPLDFEQVANVQRHTWLRLSGLYQFRQASRHLVPLLAKLASTQDPPGRRQFRDSALAT